jgi:acyl-CoA thioester hydrolase
VSNTVERYRLRIAVRPDDIDQLGHVNNVVYLRWVQDAAVAHWHAAADPQDQARLFWVVVRHEIDYLRPAFAGDDVVAVTWVGATVDRNFERLTELQREKDSKVLARARTVWCPMDRTTGRPTDVREEVRSRFSVAGPAHFGESQT